MKPAVMRSRGGCVSPLLFAQCRIEVVYGNVLGGRVGYKYSRAAPIGRTGVLEVQAGSGKLLLVRPQITEEAVVLPVRTGRKVEDLFEPGGAVAVPLMPAILAFIVVVAVAVMVP